MSSEPDKTAPVQGYGRIPWELHLRAYASYAERFGKYQSAERIAERGGFGIEEMNQFAPGWLEEVSISNE